MRIIDHYVPFTYSIELINNINLFSVANDNYDEYNCVCIIVSSHGKGGGWIYASDGEYLEHEFQKALANNKSLVNKPKLILIQVSKSRVGAFFSLFF